MRELKSKIIFEVLIDLVREASFNLRPDVLSSLKKAYAAENNSKAKNALKAILDNAARAKEESLAICQDTGMPIVFAEIGQDVHISGDLRKTINRALAQGYRKNYLRNSIVGHPLVRGRSGYFPGIIHTEIVPGAKIKLAVLPKGFGCENKSQLKMFKPTAGIDEIKQFVIESVKAAGPDACPPYVLGVGIGGSADFSALLAKKALLANLNSAHSPLEKELLAGINALKIGPLGLGGKTTCLSVKVLAYPTHIAGLPVSVNISCHALRSAQTVL